MSHAPKSSALVSVIIPMFNAENYVGEAIESVLRQTYRNLECIVVDDGSTDASSSIAQSYPVRCIRQSNAGVSAARNVGIQASRGSLIAFLDADDVWTSEKLARQLCALDANQDAGLVYSGLFETDEELRVTGQRPAPKVDLALRNSILMEMPTVNLAQTGLVPRHVLREVGGFDTNLSTSADTDLVIRIGVRYDFASVDAPTAFYRLHGNQMSLNPDAMERDMQIIYKKLFNSSEISPAISRLRRRAYANLGLAVGGSRLESGRWLEGARDLTRAFKWHPLRTLTVCTGGTFRRLRAKV